MRTTLALLLVFPAVALADVGEATARIDALWARRDEPVSAKEMDAAVSEALKAHGGEYEVLWRASRHKFWLADGAKDDRLKKQLGKEGWDYGERAVKARPDGVHGHYYSAISLGAYSQAVGILKALSEGHESKFNERLDKAISLDPSFDLGGPLLAKGRYFFELPWPKRDLEKADQLFRKVLEKYPHNLRAHFYSAELFLKDGEPKKAEAANTKVLGADVSYDPPEGRRIQGWATSLKTKIEEEL
ncbi:MAG: tetratricopeptide repeat protein [Myxococcota bacterium]